ncbi:MAG: LytR C-terminal domain-containing protein [Acidimicrobiia bacterium]
MARRRPAEPTANATRGAILVVVAVVVGLFLLRNGLDTSDTVRAGNDGGSSSSGNGQDEGDDEGDGGSTTSSTVAARPAAQVPVVVLNGTNTGGVAGKYNDALAAQGYQMGNAANANPKVAATAVFFLPGWELEAAAVAAAIGAPPTSVAALPAAPPGEIGTAQVVVVIGPDLAAVDPPAATTTTAAAATSSTTG